MKKFLSEEITVEIKDLLSFERIEVQELIGHLEILDRWSKDPSYRANLESFDLKSPMICESLKRNTLYRFFEINTRNGHFKTEFGKLYSFIKNRLSDLTIVTKNISLYEAIEYKFHFPCLMAFEDGPYGINFPLDPLYIFDTKEILYNLVLEGYILPKIVQDGLGIRQKINNKERSKIANRDLIVQTLSHILFSLNPSFKWSQKKIANHSIMKNFSLDLNLTAYGGKRPLRDAIKKIIPPENIKRGNPNLIEKTVAELRVDPLIIPNVIYKDENGNQSVDFIALKTVLRCSLLLKKGTIPKGTSFSKEDFLKLPVLQQLLQYLNANELLICEYDLMRFVQKFGCLDYFAT